MADIFRQNKKQVVLNLFTSIISPLLRLAGPYLLKLQIDQLQQRSPELFGAIYSSPFNIFLILLAIMTAVSFITQTFDRWTDYQNRKLSQQLAITSEKKLYQQYETFDAGFLANPRNRRIAQSIFQSTQLADEVLSFFYSLTNASISILGILPIIASIDTRIFLVVILATILQTVLSRRQIQRDNQERITTDKLDSRRYELHYTLLYQFHQLISIGGQERILAEYWDLMEKSQNRELQEIKRRNKTNSIQWFITQTPYWAARILVGASVMTGRASLGDFTAITLYVDQLAHVFFSMVDKLSQWKKLSLTLSKIGFFLNLKPRFTIPRHPDSTPLQGKITFHKVQFRYPNLDEEEKSYLEYLLKKTGKYQNKVNTWRYERSELQEWQNILEDAQKELPIILNNLTFSCSPGEITALIGRNGSGKTTATQFLVRNYDPSQGKITINNKNLTSFTPSHVRKYVSIITQTPLLLDNFSIRDNILLGVHETVEDIKIWALLERLNLATTIKELPKKLDSIIGDEIRLSGGQSQLITIARTMLQSRPIIIFDEGTNQLDAEHESLVASLLEEQKVHSTILLITHKLTTARKADKIYVLDEGQIVEEGNHKELLNKKGLYEKFWRLQVVE